MSERLIGPYRLLEELSSGTTGELWVAWDTRLNRRVALRTLPRLDRTAPDGAMLYKAFVQEMRQLSMLRHPSILGPLEFSPLHSQDAWYVRDYVDAVSLRDLLEKVDQLPWLMTVMVLHELASALAFTHGRGSTHGSLRPESVLLQERGRVLLGEFAVGLQVLIRAGVAGREGLGKVVEDGLYVAPEVLRNRTPDARSDVFGLGTLAYEMLTGRRPFRDVRALEQYGGSLRAQPPDPWREAGHLPESVRDLVRSMLAAMPEERPATMTQVVERLRAVLDSEGVTDVPPALAQALSRQPGVFGEEDAEPEPDPQASEATRIRPAARRTEPRMAARRRETTQMVAAAAEPDDPERTTVRGMKPAGAGDAASREQPRGGPPRRRTTTQFDAVSDDQPSTRTPGPSRAMRVLMEEGYLEKKPRKEGDTTRGAILLMIAVLVATGAIYWFFLRDAGRTTVPTAPERAERAGTPREVAPPAEELSRRQLDELTDESAAIASPGGTPEEIALRKARGALAGGNPKLAEQVLRSALEESRSDPELEVALGRALAAQGKADEAVERFLQADREAGPRAVDGHIAAAELRASQSRFEEARELYVAAIRRGADSSPVLRGVAAAQEATGALDQAIEAMRVVVDRDPGSVEDRLALAGLLAKKGQRKEAYGLYQEVLNDEPANAEARDGLQRMAALGGRPATAVAMARQTGDPGELAVAAEAAFRAGRFRQAAALFEQAIAAGHADKKKLLYNRAVALDRAGRDLDAARAYADAAQADPRNAQLRFQLGRVLARAGRESKALRAYEQAAELDARYWEPRFEAGMVELERGRWRSAAERFEEVLAIQPRHAGAMQNLGKAQIEAGQTGAAVRTFLGLARLSPRDPQPLLTAARLLEMMERKDEAARTLAEACRRGAREACQ